MSDLPTDGGMPEGALESEQEVTQEIDETTEAPEGEESEYVEGEDEPEAQPQPQRQTRQARRDERHREEAERLRQENAELRGYRQAMEQARAPTAPQVDPQQEMQMLRARWEQMAPADAMIEAMQYANNQIQRQQFAQTVQFNDRIDRQAYESEVSRGSKFHERYAGRVEQELARERGRGNYVVSRQDILYRIAGEEAVKRGTQAAPAQRRTAQTRVAAAQGQPTGARSDGTAGSRRPADDTDEGMLRIIREGFARGERL